MSNKCPSNGNKHKISVMLVDDDPAFLRILKMLLHTHYGDKVDIVGTANSGEECLNLAQVLTPQVVLMDLNMPGIGGLQTIPLLHILFPEMHIIALTCDDREKSRQAVLAAGGSDLIPKSDLKTYLIPAIEWAKEQDLTDTLMLPETV